MPQGAVGEVVAARYQLEEYLGEGGYGEVWRAVDLHRTYEVAIKFLKNRDRVGAWREASLLTALRSPYILEVNNADVVVDVPYLDTALARTTLEKQATPNGVEPSLAVDWTRRALRGLDLCHRRGLLHRDIKPDNVFMNGPSEIKLGDFGVAALMDDAGTADPHGDPRFRPPEFFTGGRASVASDIYATTVTLYVLLTGRQPFEQHATYAELEAAILAGDFPDIRDAAPHVSAALAQRVRQGMAGLAHERFASASAFDTALSLPTRERKFTPTAHHTGHDRCWTVTGKGAGLDVCVLPGAPRISIETRRTIDGGRVRKHCVDCTARDLPTRLRAIFNALR